MTKYRNGYIPSSALIKIASGTNKDGYWEHLLSPSQLAKHNALVTLARKRTGKTLYITPGWNAYRPYAAQVAAKAKYGSGAAAPGYSSHGGVYNGHDAMAMDYGNWGSVYGWNQSAFFADARAVGLEPGRIKTEPWHVIDNDPWAAVPSGGGTNGKTEPAEPEEDEDEEMAMKGAYYVRSADKATVFLLFNDNSGFYSEHAGVDGGYNNPLALNWKTGNWPAITESHANVLKGNLDKVRKGL